MSSGASPDRLEPPSASAAGSVAPDDAQPRESSIEVTAPVRPRAASVNDVLHPRGRIAPLLDAGAPALRRLVRVLFRLGQGLFLHDAFRAAPAMAFHFFLSLLPLLAFIGYAIGSVAQRASVARVLDTVLANLPPTTGAILERELANLATADRLGPIAAFGFLWIASGGMHGLMDSVEMVVGAPRRAWWKQRLLAVGWVIATLVIVAIASYGMIEWNFVIEAAPVSGARPLLRDGGARALTELFSLAAAIGGLSAFYRFSVTHSKSVRRRVLPGALTAVALWVVVSWGFSVYVRSLADYAVYYGGLAAVALLLVWLWLTSLAILVGAELNSQLEGLRD